jgi:hypothetical protein
MSIREREREGERDGGERGREREGEGGGERIVELNHPSMLCRASGCKSQGIEFGAHRPCCTALHFETQAPCPQQSLHPQAWNTRLCSRVLELSRCKERSLTVQRVEEVLSPRQFMYARQHVSQSGLGKACRHS